MIYSKQITLGNMISLAAMLLAGFGVFVDFKVELAVLKAQVGNVQNAATIATAKIDETNKTMQQVLISVAQQSVQIEDIKKKQ